jgi:PAS domain S-box-containing protein
MALTSSVGEMFRAAVAVLEALFDTDLALVLRFVPQEQTCSVEAGADQRGWLAPGAVVRAGPGSDVAYALGADVPVEIDDLAWENRFESMALLRESNVRSGVLATIRGSDGPWGLLGAFSAAPLDMSEEDVHVLRAVANVLAWSIEQRQAQRTLEALLENSPDATARFDPELRVTYVNDAFVLAMGGRAAELVGRNLGEIDIFAPQLDRLETALRAVFRSGREREACFAHGSPSGERIYRVRFIPVLGLGTEVQSVLAVAHDVTDREDAGRERQALRDELLDRDRRYEELAQQMLAQLRETRQRDAEDYARQEVVKQITKRELCILRLVVRGLTNQQIGRRLDLTAGTVRNHLGRIYPKLDVCDRTQAAVRAIELGLIDEEVTPAQNPPAAGTVLG